MGCGEMNRKCGAGGASEGGVCGSQGMESEEEETEDPRELVERAEKSEPPSELQESEAVVR